MKRHDHPNMRAMLTVQAADQVGIVARVTSFLHRHRANVEWMLAIEEDHRFRVDCCFEASPSRWDAITHDCNLDLLDLGPRMKAIRRPHTVSIVSLDQEGIVAEASAILARFGCNILMLQANESEAPMCGHRLFELEIITEVPADTCLNALEEAFDEVANKRTWHVVITHDKDPRVLQQMMTKHNRFARGLLADAEAMRAIERN